MEFLIILVIVLYIMYKDNHSGTSKKQHSPLHHLLDPQMRKRNCYQQFLFRFFPYIVIVLRHLYYTKNKCFVKSKKENFYAFL